MSKESNVRKRLEKHGLRVICVACGCGGRWWSKTGVVLIRNFDGGESAGRTSESHLRNAPCPRCWAFGLRSRYWVERHPDLALQAQERARALQRGVGR